MIHRWIKKELATAFPGYEWTIDFYTGEDNTGTILYQTPDNADLDDERKIITGNYQIYLRSSSWTQVEFDALMISESLNKRYGDLINIDYEQRFKEITYTVKSGDSLSGIAVEHDVTISEIKELNELGSDTITVGQKLKIRNGRRVIGSKSYNLLFIESRNPIRIGVEDRLMDYSINIKTTLQEV